MEFSITPLQLQDVLNVKLSGKPETWFGMVRNTLGGGVDLMRIGGKLYTGVEIRRLLNLRSTMMTVTAGDEEIVFVTKGYGHRVGMSQHGADAMARNGSSYREILAHYYTDTVLQQY
jgi:stage II sporulation protein D